MADHHDYDGITYREEKKSPAVFRILFTILAIWGIVFMGYFLFGGWSSQSEADAAKKARDAIKQAAHQKSEATSTYVPGGDKIHDYIAAGKQLYATMCAACHGENAKGVVGPDLTASVYKYGKTRTEMSKSISEGRPGGMPSFSSQLNHEQIEGLIEYLLSLK